MDILMNTIALLTGIFLLPVSISAQSGFRPIIDSTQACSYTGVTYQERMPNPCFDYPVEGGLEVFYLVEKMPELLMPLPDIEKSLEATIDKDRTGPEDSGRFSLQCLVNCQGQAGDFQIIQCTNSADSVCEHYLQVLAAKMDRWTPGIQGEKRVDMLIRIDIIRNEGGFHIVAPVY